MREGSETTDYFHVLLHYQKLEAALHANCFSVAPNNRFRLKGIRGSYIKVGLDPQEPQLKNDMTPNDPGYGLKDPQDYGRFYSESSTELMETEQGCYQKYYAGIKDAIKSGADNLVNPEDVVEVLKILQLRGAVPMVRRCQCLNPFQTD